jgi:hypothetical protein
MGETKDEVAQEVKDVFELLCLNETRLVWVVGRQTKAALAI